MKLYITFLLTLSCFVCYGQEIDSVWIATNRVPGYTRDTSIFLPDFQFFDEKGKTRTLSEFRGKILYIDIWTTWCGPCIANFPHSKKLFERLKAIRLDTAIQFINICTEDSRSAWKKKLKTHDPIGVNLYSKDTSLYKLWNVSYFPRYILLDSTGKVLCYEFSRPDDGIVDYALYAATKGIKPAEAVWLDFRQYQHYRKFGRYSDDEEGANYSKWYNSTVNERIEYFKWKQARRKQDGR